MSVSLKMTPTGQVLPAIEAAGEHRFLGCLPTPRKMMAAFTPFAAVNTVIDRKDWFPAKRPRPEVPILDQDGRSGCVGHGAGTALMKSLATAGHTFQLLSAPFIYAQINGGRDAGSSPGDAANVLTDVGVCLMSEFPEPEYLKGRIPFGAYETAHRFRATEVYKISTWEEKVSAFLLGFDVFDTILVGNSFNNLDSRGVPPVSTGQANHCTASGDELKLVNGVWLMDNRNSWTKGWGVDGRYYTTEDHYLAQMGGYEGYAVKGVATDPQDSDNPPPLI